MNRYEKFLSRLLKGEKILIDGGTGTEVERRGVPQLKNAWNAGGALTHPDIIKGIHTDFIKEGAEIIISNTFATCKHLMKDERGGGVFSGLKRRIAANAAINNHGM